MYLCDVDMSQKKSLELPTDRHVTYYDCPVHTIRDGYEKA